MIRLKQNVLFIVVLAIFALFFIGCEGPAGADGADGADGLAGADGVDGNVTCLVCHSDENLEMKRAEFAMSKHSAGESVAYAGGRASCSRCHSHEGFVNFAEGFDAVDIAGPSSWECSTCHGLHQTFESQDYALRLTDAVAIFDGGNFLLKGTNYLEVQGNSNLCANCHQSRRAEPNIASPGETFEITSTHYGPHHGAQANVLAGVGFAEIAGSIAYPAAGSSYHLTASCTGCHMAEFDNGEGGHSFNPSLAACNNCHTTADFNYGGVQAEIDVLLDELRDLLVTAGVVEQGHEDVYEINQETGVIELVSTAGDYHPVKGTYPMANARAFFNWIGLEEDRSLGVHNPKYVKALLQNSIDAM
jgi:hypothetical protein